MIDEDIPGDFHALCKELADIKFALNSSVIMAVTDAEGKITHVNDKFCEISKFFRDELLGQDYRLINSQYHSEFFMEDLWQAIRGGQTWRGEIRNRAKDGTFFWVDTTIVPFLDDNGRPRQYVAIHHDITKRKQMEEAIQALPQQIIHAQEEEHKRISREIHDDLGQSLVTLKMLIQSYRAGFSSRPDQKQERSFKKIIRGLDAIIEKTRGLAAGLRPSSLEVLGPTAAIKALINEFRCKKDLRLRFSCSRLDDLLWEGEVINLYRIIQEALTNIVRHAQATEAIIRLRKIKNRLKIIITDNGRGFRINHRMGELPLGLGFSTMRERARLLGGTFEIRSGPRSGTMIIVDIPVRSIPSFSKRGKGALEERAGGGSPAT